MAASAGQMLLDGERTSGQDVRTANVTASMAIANIVKSSLGPVGLDKMLVDDIGDVTITNDGATILQQLEVEHPAAKVLVELAHLQDQEVGDGTTSVVIVAAELLKRGNELVMNKVHPTSIMSGYRLALKEAVKFIKEKLVVPVDQVGREGGWADEGEGGGEVLEWPLFQFCILFFAPFLAVFPLDPDSKNSSP